MPFGKRLLNAQPADDIRMVGDLSNLVRRKSKNATPDGFWRKAALRSFVVDWARLNCSPGLVGRTLMQVTQFHCK